MPRSPGVACLEPRCPNYAVLGGRGRCAIHRRTEAERGYGAEWKRVRRTVRAPACARCGTTVDLTVDHIIPQSMGGTNAPSNLRTLCRSCHATIGRRSSSARFA